MLSNKENALRHLVCNKHLLCELIEHPCRHSSRVSSHNVLCCFCQLPVILVPDNASSCSFTNYSICIVFTLKLTLFHYTWWSIKTSPVIFK